jgi:hypothetical protein
MLAKRLLISGLILIFTLLASLSAQAQPDQPYDRIGVLEGKYPERGSLVIYDAEYDFPPDTPVYVFDPDIDNTKPELRKQGSRKSLTVGMRLGYTVSYEKKSRQGRIKEIWILPRGAVTASDEKR